eukprot:732349-Pleurochrysis_carterae.AAC.1
MESDVSTPDVNRAVDILSGSLIDGFSDPNDPIRARVPQLHRLANSHREERTHTVLIADTGTSISPRPHQPCPADRVGCAGCARGSCAVANSMLR